MFYRARQFIELDARDKLVFIQAWFLLGWMRAATRIVTFKHLTRSLKHHREVEPPAALVPEKLEQAVRIGGLVTKAARYTPWQSPCLAQVLTLQRILARRNIAGQFYLGVCKSDGGEGATNGLKAHAWLQCGDLVVNGEAGHQEFAVVSMFSWGRQ